jgi:hypothetical protein
MLFGDSSLRLQTINYDVMKVTNVLKWRLNDRLSHAGGEGVQTYCMRNMIQALERWKDAVADRSLVGARKCLDGSLAAGSCLQEAYDSHPLSYP